MKPNMKWSPPVKVSPNFDESYQAAIKHMDVTMDKYKKQYCVNLIDKKGSQLRIGNKFTGMVQELQKTNDKFKDGIDYVWFDFHGECKKMKWENLSKLVDIVKAEMLKHGYFMADL